MEEEVHRIVETYGNLWQKYYVLLPRWEYNALRETVLDLPLWLTVFAHCLFVSRVLHAYTGGRTYFLKSIVLTTVVAFGGSSISFLLLGEPAPLATFDANVLVPLLLLSWYLVNQWPFFRTLLDLRIVWAAVSMLAIVAKVQSVCGTVAHVSKTIPGGWAASIVLGGVSGCGGVIFLDLDRSLTLRGEEKPLSALSEPSWGTKSAFLSSWLFYVITQRRPTSALVKRDVQFAIVVLLATLAGAEALFGRSVNLMFYVERAMLRLLGFTPRDAAGRPPVDAAKKTQ